MVEVWKGDLRTANAKAADSLADPAEYPNLFPDFDLALVAEVMQTARYGLGACGSPLGKDLSKDGHTSSASFCQCVKIFLVPSRDCTVTLICRSRTARTSIEEAVLS